MVQRKALNVNGKAVTIEVDDPDTPVVPSAISNAVFDAIGVRLRSVPFTPDKVKAAMTGAA